MVSSATTLATQIFSSRYISAVGYVVLLWDTLLILPDEIERVWRGGISLAKLAYLVNHYVTIVILTVLVHAFSGLSEMRMSKQFCSDVTSLGLAGGVISLGIANYLVLLQVWQLWEQRAGIRLLLTLGWGISYSVTLIVACMVIVDLYSVVEFVPAFNICGLSHIPGLVRVIWASPIVYEVIVFSFTVFNAIDRPRPADVSLASSLYRDGVLYFVTLSILRILNLVITSISPTPFVHVGSTLIWECNTVALNRLILNQRVPLPKADDRDIEYEMFGSSAGGFQRVHSTALSMDTLKTKNGMDTTRSKSGFSTFSDDATLH